MDVQEWVNSIVQSDVDRQPPPCEHDCRNRSSLKQNREERRSDDTCRKRKLISPDTSCLKRKDDGKSHDFARSTNKESLVGRNVLKQDSNSDSSVKYKRKPRRKTRPERYEFKAEKNRRSKTEKRSSNTKKITRKTDGHNKNVKGYRGAEALGRAHLRLTGLCPSRPRLSVCQT